MNRANRYNADSAADAYAGIQLYHVIDEARQKLDPCPSRPHFAELTLPLPIPIFSAKDLEEVAAIASAQEEATAALAKDVDKATQATSTSEQKASTTPGTPVKQAKKEPPTAITPTRDVRITNAETQAQQYRESRRKPCSVGPSALRAYYIWHINTDLKPGDIAKMLREPPLQTNTVVGYILSSVTMEGLPYEKTRMKDELLAVLAPEALKAARYQALLKECHGSITPVAGGS